jgi:hypothetical protein
VGSRRRKLDSEDPLYGHAAGVQLYFKPGPSGSDSGGCYINYGLCVGLAQEALEISAMIKSKKVPIQIYLDPDQFKMIDSHFSTAGFVTLP